MPHHSEFEYQLEIQMLEILDYSINLMYGVRFFKRLITTNNRKTWTWTNIIKPYKTDIKSWVFSFFSLTPITKNLYTSFIPGKRDGLTINMKHRHKALLKVHFYARYFTYDMIGKNEEFSCSHTPFTSSC